MEVLAIMASVPAAFVACTVYCLFLVKVVLKSERVSRFLHFASYVVLVFFAGEIILLVTMGAVRSRGLLGPGFYVAHVLFFFLGPPALANSLVLHPGGKTVSKWYVATVLCTAFAFFLVLLQYSVFEALYGIDGEGGPYSNSSTTSSPGGRH